MEKGAYISTLLRSPQTVFSFKDIAMLWRDSNTTASRVRVNYYVKKGELYHIRKGFYAKDANYDRFELATRMYTPSYVSFETVLTHEGVNFQYYGQIFVASRQAKEITCDGQIYIYRKIKEAALANHAGVESKTTYDIATKERAFLDTLSIQKDYHFDNFSALDWNKVFALLPMYENQRMEKKVKEFFKHVLQSRDSQ